MRPPTTSAAQSLLWLGRAARSDRFRRSSRRTRQGVWCMSGCRGCACDLWRCVERTGESASVPACGVRTRVETSGGTGHPACRHTSQHGTAYSAHTTIHISHLTTCACTCHIGSRSSVRSSLRAAPRLDCPLATAHSELYCYSVRLWIAQAHAHAHKRMITMVRTSPPWQALEAALGQHAAQIEGQQLARPDKFSGEVGALAFSHHPVMITHHVKVAGGRARVRAADGGGARSRLAAVRAAG